MSKERYRLIEHTADMGIEAWGGSRRNAFEAMAYGLKEMMHGNCLVGATVSSSVSLSADDPVELLVRWLNEIVYLCERDSLVPSSFTVGVCSERGLQATVCGERFDPGKHIVERQVKSVTYHQACLDELDDGWYARVYVDL